MDLSLDQRYLDFRAEVRAFIDRHKDDAPPAIAVAHRGPPTPDVLDWQQHLIAHGYAARTVPKEYGGFGAEPDILENMIIGEEFNAANVSAGLAGIGIMMLVPTLLEAGTSEQKARYIPQAITGQSMEIRINGRVLATLDHLALREGQHSLPLPGDIPRGQLLEIEFNMARTVQMGDDLRELSVLFSYIGLVSSE